MIDLIKKHGETHLICDGKHPLISCAELADELLIYNIKTQKQDFLIEHFNALTGKQLCESSLIDTLSGGQKTILMFLLAIYSPAPRILFTNLFESLDTTNRLLIKDLIETCAHKDIWIYETHPEA